MAVVVVSLVSLIGVLTVPVAGKKIMRYLSAFLVAMGISALASDAVLHLIPHVSTSHSTHTAQVKSFSYGFVINCAGLSSVLTHYCKNHLANPCDLVLCAAWSTISKDGKVTIIKMIQ